LERERGIASRRHGICRLPSRRTAALVPRTRARRESKENNSRYAESGEERRGEERRGEERIGEERRGERRRREEEQSRGERRRAEGERKGEREREDEGRRRRTTPLRSPAPLRLSVHARSLARSRVPAASL